MKRYENYHKHDHESNIMTLDCVVKNTEVLNWVVRIILQPNTDGLESFLKHMIYVKKMD